MSAEVVRNFIPETTRLILSNFLLRSLWFQIFPVYVEDVCPTPTVSIPLLWSNRGLILKWPNLAVTCVLGLVLGLVGGGHLLRLSGRRNFFVWGVALVWYAMMCLGALVYHCFEPLTAFYLTDVVSTGSSSLACLAGIFVYVYRLDDTLLKWRLTIVAINALVIVTGIFAPQVIQEQVYLAPTFLALPVGILFVGKSVAEAYKEGTLWQELTTESSLLWFVLSAVSATLALVSLPADRFLCAALGSNGGSFLPWAFLGCDLFFFCAYKFVVLRDWEDTRQLKGSKSF